MQKRGKPKPMVELQEKQYKSCVVAFTFILFASMTLASIFFFIFGFVNPDPRDCYYYPGVETP